jgi:hypothetical protein
VQFPRYRDGAGWRRAQAAADAICLGPDIAWVLCDSVVRGVPLAGAGPLVPAKLGAVGSGSLARFQGGVVAGFPTAATVFFVSSSGRDRQIALPARGVACLTTVGDRLICGVSHSGTVRMFGADGRDERAFIGQCRPVLRLERMEEALFASRGEDETVRIWDVRQRNPISSVLLPHVSVCGFHNRRIGVVELRRDHGKAVLGVHTQDYTAVALSYDARADQLAMFGVIDKEPIQNSMVFLEIHRLSERSG